MSERRKRVLRGLGRNDAERASAIKRLARQLHLDVTQLWIELEERPEPMSVKLLFEHAEQVADQPRQKPEGADDEWLHHLENLSAGSLDLVDLARSLDLSWCLPGIDPFLIATTPEWFERICGTGEILLPHLREPYSAVSRFTHNDIDIVLIVDDAMAYAWVGRLGYGLAVEFERARPPSQFMRLDPAHRTALGCAFAWYIDLSLPRQAGVPGVTARALTDWLHATEYKATLAFDQQVRTVAVDPAPAHAHWVVSHIRYVAHGEPNPDHVVEAPMHLGPFMGPDDTWVTGHVRCGSNVQRLISRLNNSSALAYAVGTAFWKP